MQTMPESACGGEALPGSYSPVGQCFLLNVSQGPRDGMPCVLQFCSSAARGVARYFTSVQVTAPGSLTYRVRPPSERYCVFAHWLSDSLYAIMLGHPAGISSGEEPLECVTIIALTKHSSHSGNDIRSSDDVLGGYQRPASTAHEPSSAQGHAVSTQK
ncbi:hypothetical protein PYCCODRAFT_88494 [Trametes coccinea BRFM310]|uniref:Uncharacterized protein n=1 Tax=Trametes coccinea (strain BRFM310) TaxID=1353009 RepID=A0A1Y2I915_TRAC3|nr:hypothetical protein PYCCODRAFT_88494 [Trametes coccinea BRFM310]